MRIFYGKADNAVFIECHQPTIAYSQAEDLLSILSSRTDRDRAFLKTELIVFAVAAEHTEAGLPKTKTEIPRRFMCTIRLQKSGVAAFVRSYSSSKD